ncbi:hypothetical protein, partial [Psychromonas sp. Urea-02u-13]|uniref:hypothetical protein n=1 Tax=Psychromonas sp. Urea-02u-13 TaxID=2058326 RepID=UPI000CA89D62
TGSLFYILSLVPSRFLHNNFERCRLTYFKNDQHLLPTTINSGNPSSVAKQILNNPGFIVNTYEISTLLGGSKSPEIEDFIASYSRCRDVNIDVYLNEVGLQKKSRIVAINEKLQLKSIHNILGEIND